MPRLSIVVPAYNAQSTLAETLDAALAQGFADWECIVVDDGSTDETLSLARGYARIEERIRVLTQDNLGSAGAYNTGVAAARGDYVVLCSADDVLLPSHLHEMASFIESEPGYDIYSSNGYLWWPTENRREPVYRALRWNRVMSLSLEDVIRRCFYSVGATYRRTLFHAVGGYRTGIFAEDYDFWLRAMVSGSRHRYLPRPLSLHRVSPLQKSANRVAAYRWNITLLEELRKTHTLSQAEIKAVEQTVGRMKTLICRERVARVTDRVFGQSRLDSVRSWLRTDEPAQ